MKGTFNNRESNRKQRHRKRSTNMEKRQKKAPGTARTREIPATKIRRGGERELQSNLSSNQSVAPHDCSLQLTADAESKQCRKSLRGKTIITRGCASNSHRTLLEVAGSRINTPDRAYTKGAQRGERASGVRNDTKPSGHSGSRSSTVEHMSVGGGLHSFDLTVFLRLEAIYRVTVRRFDNPVPQA
jgi:hypothetical protein